ncbi:MAG: hypothetical protein FJ087_23505, partial [Deltaproteobacteria bacterium]|nr:hypothetical protein [Deltaproteobacteria bacterium]
MSGADWLEQLRNAEAPERVRMILRRLAGTFGPPVDWDRERPEDLLIEALGRQGETPDPDLRSKAGRAVGEALFEATAPDYFTRPRGAGVAEPRDVVWRLLRIAGECALAETRPAIAALVYSESLLGVPSPYGETDLHHLLLECIQTWSDPASISFDSVWRGLLLAPSRTEVAFGYFLRRGTRRAVEVLPHVAQAATRGDASAQSLARAVERLLDQADCSVGSLIDLLGWTFSSTGPRLGVATREAVCSVLRARGISKPAAWNSFSALVSFRSDLDRAFSWTVFARNPNDVPDGARHYLLAPLESLLGRDLPLFYQVRVRALDMAFPGIAAAAERIVLEGTPEAAPGSSSDDDPAQVLNHAAQGVLAWSMDQVGGELSPEFRWIVLRMWAMQPSVLSVVKDACALYLLADPGIP